MVLWWSSQAPEWKDMWSRGMDFDRLGYTNLNLGGLQVLPNQLQAESSPGHQTS